MAKRVARNGQVPPPIPKETAPSESRSDPQSETPYGATRIPLCVVCEKPFLPDAVVEVSATGEHRHAAGCSVVEEGKKRKAPFQSNAAALNWLRDHGWVCDTVERQNGPFKFDYLGFADIMALRKGIALLVQVTTTGGGGFAARVTKILASRWARRWMDEGGMILVFGFGKIAGKWGLKRLEVFGQEPDGTLSSEPLDPKEMA